MTKIKEKVKPASWDPGPLIACNMASPELSKLDKQNRRPGFQLEISSINRCSLLWKCNS